MARPTEPNVAAPGAPAAGQPSAPSTTSRPDPNAIAAFRAAQSATDRVNALSGQLNQLTGLVRSVADSQQSQGDEAFYEKLGQQLADGTIDQGTYTRKIAERAAIRTVIAQPQLQPAPQPQPQPVQPRPDPQAEAQRAQQLGAAAIVHGFGLIGNEPGLDFTSPKSLTDSAQRVLAARAASAPGPNPPQPGGRNVNQEMGELARQQGFVVPHSDGGHPAAAAQPVGDEDLHRITTLRRNRNAPRRMIADLQGLRDQLAAQVGTVRTGEGLLGSPSTFRA